MDCECPFLAITYRSSHVAITSALPPEEDMAHLQQRLSRTKTADSSNRDPFIDLLPNLPGQQLHALALGPDGLVFGLRKLLCRALETA